MGNSQTSLRRPTTVGMPAVPDRTDQQLKAEILRHNLTRFEHAVDNTHIYHKMAEINPSPEPKMLDDDLGSHQNQPLHWAPLRSGNNATTVLTPIQPVSKSDTFSNIYFIIGILAALVFIVFF